MEELPYEPPVPSCIPGLALPSLGWNPRMLILLVLKMVSGGGEESFMGIPRGKWAQYVSIYICEIVLQNRINEQYYILDSKLIQWA